MSIRLKSIDRAYWLGLLCICLLYNLLLDVRKVKCGNNTRFSSDKMINESDVRVVTTTLAPENLNSSDVSLLSSEEFVDAREVPTVLFDGLSNETSNMTDKSNHKTQASPETSSSQTASPVTSATPSPSEIEATTSISSATKETTSEPTTNIGDSNTEDASNDDEDTEDEPASNDHDDSAIDTSGATFEPPQNVSQYMDYIEKLFHDLRHQITDLFEPHIPQLIRTSQMVDLSSSCSYDMLRLALALRQFEPWALRMIDSSGKVPEGIFEGSFTALGSYDECLNTVFQSSSSHMMSSASQANTAPAINQSPTDKQAHTQGKYCLVTLSPFMPPKPPADKVERMFLDEANRRNYTKDDQFSRLSPMFYYMKFRIGVCIPSTCHKGDIDSISGALSSSLRLNITIPGCRVKEASVPLTRAQFTGGLVFATVLIVVIAATILDCLRMKLRSIENQELKLRNQFASGHYHNHERKGQAGTMSNLSQFKISIQRAYQVEQKPEESRSPSSGAKFEKQLGKHWSWLSFSLVTNFRLHFQEPPAKPKRFNEDEKTPFDPRQTKSSDQDKPAAISGKIHCLNGVRVLSLCWVIIANSYLTLDPRATKRLTKTREAPRDFLFQLVVQASLAIETFFFLSGLLMSLSFARRLAPRRNSKDQRERKLGALDWFCFYLHRYVRMTPPTMLVIAFSMWAYHFGDGPLWFEATQHVHQSCAQNWWRHLLHVANFIDTRQMCFIHYWYIAADMQLFLFAPVLMSLLYNWRRLGYTLMALAGSISIGLVFYTTYTRNLPPTLLFYNTDPESRREFGNTIMTKPITHVLPYMVGMLLGWCLLRSRRRGGDESQLKPSRSIEADGGGAISVKSLCGLLAASVALLELFLPYQWNNSQLPSKMMASIYAALFRLGWSLVLAYVVIACRHPRGRKCLEIQDCTANRPPHTTSHRTDLCSSSMEADRPGHNHELCFCPSGGNYVNRFLSLDIFTHLSKLSFVAYLIHLPLMSVFIGQTRGLFAFSHTLVIHFAISYLVMTFVLAFLLVHIIEFPFLTFERLLFERLLGYRNSTTTHKASISTAIPGDVHSMTSAGNFQHEFGTVSNANNGTTTDIWSKRQQFANHGANADDTSHTYRRQATGLNSGDMSERL